ncbi:efflux RND transporter periplasmic adaptor subunit [Alteromonas halophila]|uniref:Hemolysin D n=1 Tax=Alteromonas halophila TaxID=516698 RepID=A0A918JIR5_9ALTE|nr:efflux RND transporter periplasmic adaptor subunit [Alteromonas halophila]GGW81370.1 hemolysin D [Alteromonas halophila]
MRTLSLVMCLFFIAGCDNPPQHRDLLRTVVATPVTPFDGQQQHILSGVAQSAETSQLSFEVAGIVETVNVNLGDMIRKGDVLATIDSKVFELNQKQRQGALSEIEARLREARRDVERKRQLQASGAVSEAELDVAVTQLAALRDQLDVARAQLGIAEEELSDTRLIAPYPGRIAERLIEPSQRITPAQPAFSIEGQAGIEISVAVPENMVNKIHSGDNVDVEIFALDNQHASGRIFEIGSRAQSANAFPVTVRLTDEVPGLQPGMSAEVTFTFSQPGNESTFEIPLSALVSSDRNQHYVWQLMRADASRSDKDIPVYTTMRQPVEVVSLETDVARVRGNLEADMQVVRSGASLLSDGQRVHLANGDTRLFNQ